MGMADEDARLVDDEPVAGASELHFLHPSAQSSKYFTDKSMVSTPAIALPADRRREGHHRNVAAADVDVRIAPHARAS